MEAAYYAPPLKVLKVTLNKALSGIPVELANIYPLPKLFLLFPAKLVLVILIYCKQDTKVDNVH